MCAPSVRGDTDLLPRVTRGSPRDELPYAACVFAVRMGGCAARDTSSRVVGTG
ncbi:hypothetical protein [Streptomyces sp. NPDC054794]